MQLRILFPALAGVALACAACGSSMPQPTEPLAQSEAAARAAQELGADRDPHAAFHLQLAKEQTRQARVLMREGDNERADRLLSRARADAELSVALAKQKRAVTEAEEAKALVEKAKQVPVEPRQQPQQP